MDLSWLDKNGISTKDVIAYTGGEDKYISAVQRFFKSYESNRNAIEELLARIRVALKLYNRTDTNSASGTAVDEAGEQEGVYTWNKLILNELKHTVTYDGHEISLTNREFLMLKTLLANKDIVLSRDTLLEKVCGYDYIGETNVVDVYIRFLRSKIDEVFGIKYAV